MKKSMLALLLLAFTADFLVKSPARVFAGPAEDVQAAPTQSVREGSPLRIVPAGRHSLNVVVQKNNRPGHDQTGIDEKELEAARAPGKRVAEFAAMTKRGSKS
jgi:hypothetical protein